jgi:hypothetical protein
MVIYSEHIIDFYGGWFVCKAVVVGGLALRVVAMVMVVVTRCPGCGCTVPIDSNQCHTIEIAHATRVLYRNLMVRAFSLLPNVAMVP